MNAFEQAVIASMRIYGMGAEVARLRGLWRTYEYLTRVSMDIAKTVQTQSSPD